MTAKACKEEVEKLYKANGWSVYVPGGVNDYVAYRERVSHYIRVIVGPLDDDPRCSGTQKGDFVQNAMSNHATPIFAVCAVEKKKQGETVIKTKFINANTMGTSVIKKRETRPKKGGTAEPENKAEEV